jgi:cytochrome P450
MGKTTVAHMKHTQHVPTQLHTHPPSAAAAGADLFISVWNLHHSPYLWKDPEAFRPERFDEVHTNTDFGGKWAGEH